MLAGIAIDAAELEQVVLDLLEHERVEVFLGLRPVGHFAGIESNELDCEAGLLGAGEGRLGRLGQLIPAAAAGCMLELVIGISASSV